jgi:peptidyl-prolyl cis-trans isomerase-like 4
MQSLDDKHTLFGEVAEDESGLIAKLNATIVDDDDRPLQNMRIRRTTILDDPFPDPTGLGDLIPEESPEPVYEFGDRLEEDWRPEEETRCGQNLRCNVGYFMPCQCRASSAFMVGSSGVDFDVAVTSLGAYSDEEEIEAEVEAQKAKNRKILLEMIGDRPDADAKAPEEFLFVCKLNPITTEEDLETIFSRFGQIVACDIIRDRKTGDSLNYAFIGFDEKKAAEEAYLKMNNALIDDRLVPSLVQLHQLAESLPKYGGLQSSRGTEPAQPAAVHNCVSLLLGVHACISL